MLDQLVPLAEWCTLLVELLGIAIITLSAVGVLLRAIVRLLGRAQMTVVYREIRQQFGRGILLGLEFMVAADIIETVAVDLSWDSVGVLAMIVLIRTFLSITLELELDGRWPWQGKQRLEG